MVIHRMLYEDTTLEDRANLSPDRSAELLEVCWRSTYFSYQSEFYQQKEGVAMGSLASAVITNLYMDFFEELALNSATTMPLKKTCE